MKYQTILLCFTLLPSIGYTQSDNTKEWATILSGTSSIAKLPAHPICFSIKNESLGVKVELNGKRFNAFRSSFIVSDKTDKTDNRIVKQFSALKDIGYFRSYKLNGSVSYKVTPEGFANGYRISRQGGCFIAGKWEVSSILEYNKRDDKGAGVDIYQVIFETDVVFEPWANKEIRTLFNSKVVVPKTYTSTFIKGKKGWYLDPLIMPSRQGQFNRSRHKYRSSSLPLPTAQQVQKMAEKNEWFINSICQRVILLSGFNISGQDGPCKKDNQVLFKVHQVTQHRGNIVKFTATFGEKGKAAFKAGSFSLVLNKNNKWDIGTSGTLH